MGGKRRINGRRQGGPWHSFEQDSLHSRFSHSDAHSDSPAETSDSEQMRWNVQSGRRGGPTGAVPLQWFTGQCWFDRLGGLCNFASVSAFDALPLGREIQGPSSRSRPLVDPVKEQAQPFPPPGPCTRVFLPPPRSPSKKSSTFFPPPPPVVVVVVFLLLFLPTTSCILNLPFQWLGKPCGGLLMWNSGGLLLRGQWEFHVWCGDRKMVQEMVLMVQGATVQERLRNLWMPQPVKVHGSPSF